MDDAHTLAPSPGSTPQPVAVDRVAELFGLLSDRMRVGILYSLLDAGSLTTSELCEWTGRDESEVRSALRALRTARVVDSRKSGSGVTFHLRGDHVRRLLQVASSAAIATRRPWQLRSER